MDLVVYGAVGPKESERELAYRLLELALQREYGLDSLPEHLRELARLRLDNPEMTLRELGERLGVSRSGVNHRLQKLLAMGEALLEEKGVEGFM